MKVNFYATYRPIVGGKTVEFDLDHGITLRQLVQAIITRFPAMQREMLDDNGQLYSHVHIFVNGRDVRYLDNPNATVASVMTPRERLVTAPPSTSLEDARRILYQSRIEKLPLVDDSGRLAGLITGSDIEKRITFTHAAKDANGRLRCAGGSRRRKALHPQQGARGPGPHLQRHSRRTGAPRRHEP